jgi:hypothetical protein
MTIFAAKLVKIKESVQNGPSYIDIEIINDYTQDIMNIILVS